ncbi:MAG: DUF6364 family protein [Firmicutes bacterium]|nr:DUF6364 family protein [Bacillota bacterium]
MGIEKKVLSIRVDQELIDELKIIAKSDNRPLSNLIETVLKQYVGSKKETKRPAE